jgi:antibiotic biosynthesis monooxygenase (ABM) superfamily enzyme
MKLYNTVFMQHPPKKWKMALLVWAAIYPLITILSVTLFPLTQDWPVYLRTLLMSAILVPVMVLVVFPFINKRFAVWLRK